MSLKKKNYIILSFIISIFYMINLVFSVCNFEPVFVEIRSGANTLGNFNSGDDVFIKSDLQSNPLKLIFTFNNTQNGCFNSQNDVTFLLFSAGSEVNSDSITTTAYENNTYYITKATFTFNPTITLSSTLRSTYNIKNTNSGFFMFYPDTEKPTLNYVVSPLKTIYGPNEIITINYDANDDASGIKYIRFQNAYTENINLNGAQMYFGNINLTLDSTKTLNFAIEDMLGNSYTEVKSFVVDSNAPTFNNFKKVYSFRNNVRYASFEITVSDLSFNYTNTAPVVYANFATINPSYINTQGNCLRSSNNTYICSWNDLIISLDSTQSVNIRFNLTDSLSNSAIVTQNTEIFVDKAGPEILEFYLQNSYGQSNIFRPTDNDTRVYLKLKDSSFAFNSLPRIVYTFDRISIISPICSKNVNDNTEINCIWSLSNSILQYQNANNQTIVFSVIASDEYLNSQRANITITIDKSKPLFNSVELFETESIKDGVIKSGEIFNFKVFLNEENLLVNGSYNVYSKLSSIDVSKISDTQGNCQRYNETTVQCDFTNIAARNGYVNTSAIFYAIDSAGNYNNISYKLEILKIGNETPDAFRVIDNNKYNIGSNENLLLLNPINRDTLKSSGVNVWFKGKLVPIDSNSKYTLVNYALKDCSWSDANPIISNKESIFKSRDNMVIYQKAGDDEFALKVELHNHPNYNDMNDIYMNCTFGVVKRDNQTIYGTNIANAEEVKFKLKFSFYANPRGDLLKANAAKVLEKIEETETLGSWFDTTYQIYNVFNQVCNVVSTGTTMLNTVNGGLNLIQANPGTLYCDVNSLGLCTGPLKSGTEIAKGTLMYQLTNKEGFVSKICDYVTCRNGGLLSLADIPGVKDYMALNDQMCSAFTNEVFVKKDTTAKETK